MFENDKVNIDILRKRAYNLRWATTSKDIIPLTAADPDFQSAPEIAEAITAYSKDRYFCYGPPEGLPEFKESLSNYFQVKRSVPVSPSFVLPVDSAAFAIYLTCKTFLKPGEEAIIFDPVDFLFRYSIESVGGVAVPFAMAPSTEKVDFTVLEKLISDRTKLICLCNPCNPTGKVFTKKELNALGLIACKHNLIILSDEIWSDIVFSPSVFTSIASINDEIRNRTITVTGFSKSYGLAGLRIGAVIAHNSEHFSMLFEASLHNFTIHGANVLSQVAATAALDKCDYWPNEFVAHISNMRDIVVKELNSIPGFHCSPPQGCYVAFIDISETNKTSQEIHDILLNKAKVAVVPGLKKWFGKEAEGYIRICFSTSESILLEAMSRIKTVIQ
ncbi:MAG: pyridoxal phosphate-dependent aminotransferase [Flavobacteriales bacterium]|nr:pyridoxal phosphate-dependent aminotransferase [Flavobacteriales bacterium]